MFAILSQTKNVVKGYKILRLTQNDNSGKLGIVHQSTSGIIFEQH